jgi:hypothetical protein
MVRSVRRRFAPQSRPRLENARDGIDFDALINI